MHPAILSDLQTFVVVARLGNISQAVARLHCMQNAISRQIQALEVVLGGALFTREARGLSLTAAGQRFFEAAEGVHISLERAVQPALPRARSDESPLVALRSWLVQATADSGACWQTLVQRGSPAAIKIPAD